MDQLDQLKPILEYASGISITGPVALVVLSWIIRDTLRNLSATLLAKVKQTTDNHKIQKLETFQVTAETNHFTDITKLLEREEAHERTHQQMWEKINKISNDVAYIRGRIGNGGYPN